MSAKGWVLCLPCGREISTSSAASFVATLSTATLETSLCLSFVQSVVWIVPRRGIFPRQLMTLWHVSSPLLTFCSHYVGYQHTPSANHQRGKDAYTLTNRVRPHLTGRPEQPLTSRCILPFRSEFRPLDTLRFLFSPVSHPYRGNTTVIDG